MLNLRFAFNLVLYTLYSRVRRRVLLRRLEENLCFKFQISKAVSMYFLDSHIPLKKIEVRKIKFNIHNSKNGNGMFII